VGSKKRPLDKPRHKTSGGATNEDIYFEQVDQGEKWCVQHVAARDNTSAFSRLLLGVERQGSYRWIEDTPSPAAGTYYTFHEPIYLYEGDRLVVRFVGTTSGDSLEAVIRGYEEPLEE